jgi:ketosteroid isomerase-like protein
MFPPLAAATVLRMDALQLINKTTDTWNNRDRNGYLACYAHDCEIIAPGFAGTGHQAVNEFWDAYMNAFPDNRVVLATTVGGRSQAAAEEARLEGTHTGPLPGADGAVVPPSGNHVSVPFTGLHTERDGQLISSRFYFDQLDFLGQLGALAGLTEGK